MNQAVEITSAAPAVFAEDGSAIITSASGKKIGVKRPPILSQYRLIEALGDAAENRVYLRMCIPLLWVTSIDGVAVLSPVGKREVEGLIARLDEDGIAAVSDCIESQFAQKNEATAAKK